MIGSNLCDFSDAYILVKVAITVPNMAATDGTILIKKHYLKIVLHLLIAQPK